MKITSTIARFLAEEEIHDILEELPHPDEFNFKWTVAVYSPDTGEVIPHEEDPDRGQTLMNVIRHMHWCIRDEEDPDPLELGILIKFGADDQQERWLRIPITVSE